MDDLLPQLDSEKPSQRFRLSPRWMLGAIVSAMLAVSLATGAFIRLPYYAIGPGPARDVVGLVHIKGAKTFPARGALLLTTVSVSGRPISLYDGLASLFDPATELIPSDALLGGRTPQEEDEYNVARMVESKYFAAVVALRALGRPVAPIPGGRLLYVFSNSPGKTVLRAGDVVQAVNGKPVIGIEALSKVIRSSKPGRGLKLTILRDKAVREITVRTFAATGDDGKVYAAIGVWLSPAFALPVDIQIDTQDIGGPSGGLVFALTIVDVLSEGNLTKGHRVGVTGTINLD
ncbi:MAG: PDZ domain-containing protein, partial [Actinobacteria bacterium]|nr:PDZ domain-containing protein [Actinomycetota bacterium]